MARVNVHLPDDLAALIRTQTPGLNVSAVLQDALRDLVSCTHEHLTCSACGATVERAELTDLALSAFYTDIMWELQEPVSRCETAEGAARVLKALATGRRISAARTVGVPRPTRSQRERHAHDIEAETLTKFAPPVVRPKRRNRAA